MDLVVHDYSGHPFQVQLSRGLARRGDTVTHQYCASFTTGQGALGPTPTDPPSLTIEPLSLGRPFARYSPARRLRQELAYGWSAIRAVTARRPDVALVANMPLFSLGILATGLRRRRIPYVLWQQDLYSAAIADELHRRLGAPGALLAQVATRLERRVARWSQAVVAISPAFTETLDIWGVPPERIAVIPNWAPVGELTVDGRDPHWVGRPVPDDRPLVLYAGTLGLKHDPSLLATAAEGLDDLAHVVVVSEGRGREWLHRAREERGLTNLHLLDFQPYADLPAMLGAADVLLAILEPEASRYSVPSKVLSYLCAGRPVVAVLPEDNPAAQLLTQAGAGVVVAPGDRATLVEVLRRLLADPIERARLGHNGRRHAEEAFRLDPILDRFRRVLSDAVHDAHQLPGRDPRTRRLGRTPRHRCAPTRAAGE
ncbi:MAG TPA: glycosyltransferase family 4 protein [Acidimicrobiales bacterium]|nr:glycosyltransferase family 4 protein [Acidimicrobiales bacterium]